jgi:hypothetical protein
MSRFALLKEMVCERPLFGEKCVYRIAATLLATALSLSASGASALKMEFAGDQVLLEGDVVEGDTSRFNQIVTQHKDVLTTVIVRNCPGGRAEDGYRIGALIRDAGLRTALSGYALSSCSRIFLGGKERQFSDDQRVGLNRVGFHGNYSNTGQLLWDGTLRLRPWIAHYSDGKADPALVERWTAIPNRNGFIYFFDSTRLQRADKTSVFLCSGTEPRENRFDHCEKFPTVNGYDMGIFTSPELVKINEKLRLKRPAE